MPWFQCDDCGDTVKKPKLAAHCGQCSASGFTCIDCSRPFDRHSVQGHTQCVTEHEKYAQGATKPGGFAAAGFYGEGAPQAAAPQQGGAAEGLQFLSTRSPWVCSVCNVTCTSKETLLGHAQGAKHKRRSRAAGRPAQAAQQPEDAAAKAGGVKEAAAPAAEEPAAAKKPAAGAAAGKAPKWKKLAAAELKRNGGSMKAKKMLAAVLAAAAAAAGGAAQEEGAEVLSKLQKSKQFFFEGKAVRLAA